MERRLQLRGSPFGAPHREEIAGQVEACWGAEPHRVGPPTTKREEGVRYRGPQTPGQLPNKGIPEGSNDRLPLPESEPESKASDERHCRLIGAIAGPARRRITPESSYRPYRRRRLHARDRTERRFAVSLITGLISFLPSSSSLILHNCKQFGRVLYIIIYFSWTL
ncbi:hypothetical protein SAY87_016725 [Trapa incisa]|uniref:Uncharacterized protein n=1 Tax=Trapa incisa TaxID=236973 RepID=A0AAN7QUL1_9MYRT|nr:hypothetical protein SAY87_016725 [Trapa incisa]